MWIMNLRQFKKCSLIKIKSMQINDGDILVLSADINKINPKLCEQFYDVIKRNIKARVIPIVLPTDMFLEKSSKETLIKYVKKVQEYIDKLGE